MCRVMAYVGRPVRLDDLLFGPDRALVRQSVDPALMSLLNLGGFGVIAWDRESRDPAMPFTYRTADLPVYDRNLKALAEKAWTTTAIAHVRGVVYEPSETVGPHNVHPFRFPGAAIVLAQNGDLFDFGRMRYDLLEHIDPALARRIEGTTDTEWLYALVLSQLDDPFAPAPAVTIADAVERALTIIRAVRDEREINTQSPVNVVASDGDSLVATRFAFDYGWYPDDDSFFAGEREHDFTTLWFTLASAFAEDDSGEWGPIAGTPETAIVASEPLTTDRSAWLEIPEYSMLIIDRAGGELTVQTRELAL